MSLSPSSAQSAQADRCPVVIRPQSVNRLSRPAASVIVGFALAWVAASGAQATFIHAPYSPYSVEVQPSSTTFNAGPTWNGGEARFQGGKHYGPGSHFDTFSAVVKADVGYSIDKLANLTFGGWNNYGTYYYKFEWSIPGAAFTGPGGESHYFLHEEGGAGSWYEMLVENTAGGDVHGYTAAQWNWGGGHAADWLIIVPN